MPNQVHHMQLRQEMAPPEFRLGSMPVRSASRTENRILGAIRIVATLVETDEGYLPIFLRLESELKKEREKTAALQRVRAYSQK